MEYQPLTATEVAQLFESVTFATGSPAEQFRGFDRLLVARPEFVARAAQTVLLRTVAGVWSRGWQPVELHRQVRRATNGTGAKLVVGLIAEDHHSRAGVTIDPRWAAQLAALGIPSRPDPDWIVHWAGRRTQTDTTLALLIDMVRAIARLGPLTVLIPPPGTHARDQPMVDLTTPLDDPMLDRVRALLAKAESTEFQAEAEAFTAKAQELMARYSIDAAMLSARTANADGPITVRIPIDDPYADAKAFLCQVVADHSRARAVQLPEYGMSTVIGFAADVAATEILFTSLLVQAQTAMQSASVTAGTRARSAGFRSTFLLAYAHRVGERLGEINTHVAEQATRDLGTSLVPVLAARTAAVDAAVSERFGRLSQSRPRWT